MKETGLIFKAPMVRAILEGRKTQTRRVAKEFVGRKDLDNILRRFPKQSGGQYGEPGDRIYVRETARSCRAYEVQGYPPSQWGNKPIWFEADGTPPGAETAWATKATPAIHLPMFAARIWLEITGVRVERIQEITPDDCIAEGAWPVEQRELGRGHEAVSAFRELWESTGGDWDANPWVWAIDFKVLSTTGRPA